MSREYCQKCTRAIKGCICQFVGPVSNRSLVTILRHPSEIKSIKGTAQLLALSMDNIRLLDGEVFQKIDVLKQATENILIFPSDSSINLKTFIETKDSHTNKHFIFIDGTWKKAYKILQLNPYLKDIIHLNLQIDSKSPYSEVRKQRSGGLSTLEAVVNTLKSFEDEGVFENLEKSFINFIDHLKKMSN